jgi:hypothetical protein
MSAPKQQTAVQWLTSKIADQRENGNTDLRSTLYYCEQAKAIEKEQIKDAYEQGESDGYKQFIINIDKRYESFEQYYKETYERT